jgi:hypothetical protein
MTQNKPIHRDTTIKFWKNSRLRTMVSLSNHDFQHWFGEDGYFIAVARCEKLATGHKFS